MGIIMGLNLVELFNRERKRLTKTLSADDQGELAFIGQKYSDIINSLIEAFDEDGSFQVHLSSIDIRPLGIDSNGEEIMGAVASLCVYPINEDINPMAYFDDVMLHIEQNEESDADSYIIRLAGYPAPFDVHNDVERQALMGAMVCEVAKKITEQETCEKRMEYLDDYYP